VSAEFVEQAGWLRIYIAQFVLSGERPCLSPAIPLASLVYIRE